MGVETRLFHGIEIPVKPTGRRAVGSPLQRWRLICETLAEVMDLMPRNAYSIFQDAAELYARARGVYETLKGEVDVEQQRRLFCDDDTGTRRSEDRPGASG